MENIYKYTIKLVRFVLNGDKPDLPGNIDFEQLFSFAKSHGVENMAYVALRDLKIVVPQAVMKKFKRAYEMSIMLEAMQAFELDAVTEAFEEKGIDNIPLKGSVIKYLYPMPDYRKSADIDILVYPDKENEIETIMTELGYRHDPHFDKYEVHFAYNKPPYIEVEMHRMLTRQNHRSYKFCSQAWKYATLKDGYKHQYEFSDEYLYMHLMAHLAHHLYRGGVGIKHITDFYVILKNKQLDNELLEKYLKKAKLTELNKIALGLAQKWFCGSYAPSADIDALERIIFTSGSFGNEENKNIIRSSDTGANKLRLFIKQIFPPARDLKTRYKVLEKRPYLIVPMWFYRFYEIVFHERNTISEKVGGTFDSSKKSEDLTKLICAIRDNR